MPWHAPCPGAAPIAVLPVAAFWGTVWTVKMLVQAKENSDTQEPFSYAARALKDWRELGGEGVELLRRVGFLDHRARLLGHGAHLLDGRGDRGAVQRHEEHLAQCPVNGPRKLRGRHQRGRGRVERHLRPVG